VEDFASFARLIEALRPWLGHLVVVGGWGHRLHRFHPLANPPAYLPLRTRDADLAFATNAPLNGDVRAALRISGFEEELFGDQGPPATHYRLVKEDTGFYAEFLTPLEGDGFKRNGQRDDVIARAGITAQRMRHLEVLLVSKWGIQLGPELGVPIATTVTVLVPNAVSFIVQKLLIHGKRPPAKKAQDVLYIHDTLELFGDSLESLRALWVDAVYPTLHRKAALSAQRITREIFGQVTDTIRQAARLPQNRELTAEGIRAACEYAMGQVFDADR